MRNLLCIAIAFFAINLYAQDSLQVETADSTVVENTSSEMHNTETVPSNIETTSGSNDNEITPSQGFSLNSLWRGVLGMISLLFIAFLFSSNKKAIDWKKVAIGLSLQLVIAIGVLKISFIQKGFELIGGLFIEILNYTRAGSKFLFEGLVVDMDKFGYIFAFQVLPTIIFFSALTSLLFYLGIIQKLVKLLALLLSKVLGISGMESLSVAGNIFLRSNRSSIINQGLFRKDE